MAQSRSRFERQIKKHVAGRTWDDIASRWLDFLPEIDPPGSPPDLPLRDFLGFEQASQELYEDDTPSIRREVIGLRETLFQEATYLLHKATHVIGLGENNVVRGHPTWALSDSYHGAFFCVKSIIMLLGVAITRYDNKWVIVDVWPSDVQKKRKRQVFEAASNAILFIKPENRVEHRHFWLLFQRLLRVADVNVWPKEYVDMLKRLKHGEYALQRHRIHYFNEVWIHDDLHARTLIDGFGIFRDRLEEALDPVEESDFSVVLSLILLRMAHLLYESINTNTNRLEQETELLLNKISQTDHPIYVQNFEVI